MGLRRTPLRSVVLCVLLATATGCGDPGRTAAPTSASAEPLQCGKDTDCKGERICDAGTCVDPKPKPVASVGEATADTRATTASADAEVAAIEPVPVCVAGDRRTRIPVWKPEVDDDGNLSSDPPQKDGMIVYIDLSHDAAKVECKDTELNAFSRPSNPKDVMEGGLAVNLRGNTQFANGFCHFRGYYMNEDVMGVHQGWVETYFGAVEKQTVVVSDKFCLAERID
jgi:hypothetical protein